MRVGGKDDIAGGFIGTGDNGGGSIFSPPTDVTGMNEPYEKFGKALRA